MNDYTSNNNPIPDNLLAKAIIIKIKELFAVKSNEEILKEVDEAVRLEQ